MIACLYPIPPQLHEDLKQSLGEKFLPLALQISLAGELAERLLVAAVDERWLVFKHLEDDLLDFGRSHCSDLSFVFVQPDAVVVKDLNDSIVYMFGELLEPIGLALGVDGKGGNEDVFTTVKFIFGNCISQSPKLIQSAFNDIQGILVGPANSQPKKTHLLIVLIDEGSFLHAGDAIEQILGAPRMHSLAWTSRRERTRRAQQHSQNIKQLHVRTFEWDSWECNSELEELIVGDEAREASFVCGLSLLRLFPVEIYIGSGLHLEQFFLILERISAIVSSGFWILDIEIIVFSGTIFCWNWRNALLVRTFPSPPIGIPTPLSPKAALLDSYTMLVRSAIV